MSLPKRTWNDAAQFEAMLERSGVPEAVVVLYALVKEVEELREENARLRRCLSEHHAAGVLEGVLIGEDCPVCEWWLK